MPHDQEMRAFHQRLRRLLNIDRSDLINAGALSTDDSAAWLAFRDDPFRFFIRTDDETCARIWSVIERTDP